MADSLSKVQELIWWAWSYPVPWVWIGLGIAALVCLIGLVGMVVGIKMKRETAKTPRGRKGENVNDDTRNAVMNGKIATGENDRSTIGELCRPVTVPRRKL